MTQNTTVMPDRLDAIEARLVRLEELIGNPTTKVTWNAMRETPVEPWQHLVRRQHRWRKQLYVKGRNMTARQLVGSVKANEFDEARAAENHHLPVEAIREALAYVEQCRQLLESEAEIERLMLQRGGTGRGPQPVS